MRAAHWAGSREAAGVGQEGDVRIGLPAPTLHISSGVESLTDLARPREKSNLAAIAGRWRNLGHRLLALVALAGDRRGFGVHDLRSTENPTEKRRFPSRFAASWRRSPRSLARRGTTSVFIGGSARRSKRAPAISNGFPDPVDRPASTFSAGLRRALVRHRDAAGSAFSEPAGARGRRRNRRG